MLEAFPREPGKVKEHIAEYYAMITHLDAGLGRMLDWLEETGQRENTLIVFAGDNGLAVGRHGLMGKQNLYDHSVRVPLIFAGPGFPAGERRDDFCYLSDIFPRLCDASEIDTPPTVTGRSLFPFYRRSNSVKRDALYLAYCDTIRGLRTDRFKLIEYATEANGRAPQLFDLKEDPDETRNLAGTEAGGEILADLRKRMVTLRDAEGDLNHRHGQAFWSRVGMW